MFSAHHKEKRLREGGVEPEIFSPAGLMPAILKEHVQSVKAANPNVRASAHTSRVVVYVDGFNLYFGLRSKGWRKYYWLDLVRLSRAMLKADQQLEAVHYFTSRLVLSEYNAKDVDRQGTYLEALSTSPLVTLHFGHFLGKPQRCRACGSEWMRYEEKMTDVNIAVKMLGDAFEDRFDTALLVSADSDLTTPVQQVLSRFPEKRVVVAQPQGRNSASLCRAASGYFTIGEAKLRGAQLPIHIPRTDGSELTRPDHWR